MNLHYFELPYFVKRKLMTNGGARDSLIMEAKVSKYSAILWERSDVRFAIRPTDKALILKGVLSSLSCQLTGIITCSDYYEVRVTLRIGLD